jgi:hypothetical protein
MGENIGKQSRRIITKCDIDAVRGCSVWDLGNGVLYDLCRNFPGHKTIDEIIAKIWLIGRSYAASIERRKNAKPEDGDFYETTVAPRMKQAGIDEWLAALSKSDLPGNPMVISIHKKLMDLFESMTELNKRSLASKYLHFHVPEIFFIYDSRARRAITKVVPRLNLLPDIAADHYDTEYKDFVRRCVWLLDEIRSSHQVVLTPRQIDKLLLNVPVTGKLNRGP